MKRRASEPERRAITFNRNAGWIGRAESLGEAVKVVVAGLGELPFEDKRIVLAIAAAVHEIDAKKLGDPTGRNS